MIFNLSFRKYDSVDVWNFQLKGKDYSVAFYSPTFKNAFCWWDKFNQYDSGEKITYLCFLWVKVEVIEKLKLNKHTKQMYESIAKRLPDKDRHELHLKLIEAKYCELLDILEVSHRLELEGIDNVDYSRLEVDSIRQELVYLEDLLNFYDAITKESNRNDR